MYACICIYIYIYIEIYLSIYLSLSLSLYIYIYIYRHRESEREREREGERDRKGTNGVSTNGVTAVFMCFDRRCLLVLALNLLLGFPKCQGVPVSTICQNSLLLQRPHYRDTATTTTPTTPTTTNNNNDIIIYYTTNNNNNDHDNTSVDPICPQPRCGSGRTSSKAYSLSLSLSLYIYIYIYIYLIIPPLDLSDRRRHAPASATHIDYHDCRSNDNNNNTDHNKSNGSDNSMAAIRYSILQDSQVYYTIGLLDTVVYIYI